MKLVDRMNLLFLNDEELLMSDTGLNTVRAPVLEADYAARLVGEQESLSLAPEKLKAETSSYSKQTFAEMGADPGSKETTRISSVHVASRKAFAGDKEFTELFCPILAASRFPYKYVRGALSQRIAHQFFDEGKFWSRTWDLYYVPVPSHISSRPLLLVPAAQVQQLLSEINASFNVNLSLLTVPTRGLILHFKDDGTPQPLYLGQSTSKEAKDNFELQSRASAVDLSNYPASAEDMLAFEGKICAGVAETKSKKRSGKSGRQQGRLNTDIEYTKCMIRVQCYLGLRDAEAPIDESLVSVGEDSPTFNLTLAAPFHAWKEPVFISIDVESNEYSHSEVTEVGISVLDTLDLANDGTEWTSRIQSRHFRVREYASVINSNFVMGCPDKFEFGQSEWVALADLASAVEGCFTALSLGAKGSRNIILVGHGIAGDVKYLHDIGVTIFDKDEASSIILERIDTAQLFRVWKKEPQTWALSRILHEFGIVGWHLHNAGNDARYTLEAMIHMAVKAKQTKKSD